MFTLFMCLVLCADEPAEKKPAAAVNPEPIPVKVREYFERGDVAKTHMLDVMKKKLDELELEIRSIPATSGERKRLIRQRESIEADYRETKVVSIKPWLPRTPRIGDLGHAETSHLDFILDAKTVIGHVGRSELRDDLFGQVRSDYRQVIIRNWNKASPKRGDRIDEEELFRVKAVAGDDQAYIEGLAKYRVSVELERIPRGDVWKWRAQYDKEKKETPAPALDPDEKPAAKPADAKDKNPDNPRRPGSR